MISSFNSIRIVKVNRENWKLSSCTCSYWLKNYYCCHSIACCYRLKLMNFYDIGMDIPLNNKPKRGAKKKTRSLDTIFYFPIQLKFDVSSMKSKNLIDFLPLSSEQIHNLNGNEFKFNVQFNRNLAQST
ncbi:hypothetical protein BpHYR1_045147 [Brachionus plicatilis]|uniref:SWIM-type domain-containing protein n=1 Tax=Brachionus plicatilis TaxID=10195 RepID=A0A3M7QR37_BRAPC|nr:hypothetical protein BpHYR1_045147 [Brachionus plicatilis]